MEKRILTAYFIIFFIVYISCDTNDKHNKINNIIKADIQPAEIAENSNKQPVKNNYENTLESFTEFCNEFEKYIIQDNYAKINELNKSGKSLDDLGFEFFKDTNGLISRNTAVNLDMGGFEYASNYESTEKDEEGYPLYESAIYYYFSYNRETKLFELKEVLMAG